MIKFFRKIRKNLLSENKFSKYLLYAIGEIALVMIGILLALSVSNWNTNRQENESNVRLLEKLDSELQLNIDRLSFLKNHEQGYIENLKRNDSLEVILNNGLTENDIEKLVKLYFIANTLNLHTSTYEEMKNTGRLYKLGSDKLLGEIETYYRLCDRESYYVLGTNKRVVNQSVSDIDNGYFKVRHDYRVFGKETAIKDNPWLFNKDSKEYKGLRRKFDFANLSIKTIISRINRLIETSEKLQESIREELEDH
jgi:hypothetical protein